MSAVVFESVSKRFGTKVALDDVSFSLPEAKITGLLGPNGSGKTTALRLILNLFHADAGTVSVFGSCPSEQSSDLVGYLPEERGLYRKMTVIEVLRYYARLKGKQPSLDALRHWLKVLKIEEFEGRKIQGLSKGTAQKVQFITTVLHDPHLLILDEPFSGLDPLSREHLQTALLTVVGRGISVILSTHDMTVAENLCDHFLMLSSGSKVLDASRQDITTKFGASTVKVQAALPLTGLEHIEGVSKVIDFGNYHELVIEQECDTNAILHSLAVQAQLVRFELSRPSLHDIFLRLAHE